MTTTLVPPSVAPHESARHSRVVAAAVLIGTATLVSFRLLLEAGFAPAGSLFVIGVPLEYAWIVWFLAAWALHADRRALSDAAWLRLTVYEWWLGILGLAGAMWMVQTLISARLITTAAWAYWIACACSIAVFLSAASINRTAHIAVARSLITDTIRILSRPVTWACAISAIGVLAFAPRSMEVPARGAAFQRWYSRQVPMAVPASWQVTPVTLVEIVDYQCPVCRRAESQYRDVIEKAEAAYGDSFGFIRVDFPLENECNSSDGVRTAGGLHLASCEAAAAVRAAGLVGRVQQERVVEWLWAHQSQLTPDVVFDGVTKEFGIDVRRQYHALLPDIRRDATEARRLRVSGTPSYFLNGRQLPLVTAEAMSAAIATEMRRMDLARTGDEQ